MYKMYDVNRKIRDTQQWKENLDHVIMGNGELLEFFECRSDFSSNEEAFLKKMFDAASTEEKKMLSKLLKRMIRKDRH